MAENNFVNLFSLSYDAINGMNKKDLFDHTENLKRKVVVGNDIQGLFNQISKLSQNVNHRVTAKEKLSSELFIVRNANQNLQNRIINQNSYPNQNRRKNLEITGISNEFSDPNLEETVIGICKDYGIDVNPLDTEGCHRLPLGRNATNTTKRGIVKLPTENTLKLCFSKKRTLTRKVRLFLATRCVLMLLWGKCIELLRNGQVN